MADGLPSNCTYLLVQERDVLPNFYQSRPLFRHWDIIIQDTSLQHISNYAVPSAKEISMNTPDLTEMSFSDSIPR